MPSVKKVLVSDAVDEQCVQLLKSGGIDVTCKFGLSVEELKKEIPAYDGLVVRSDTKVTEEILTCASRLSVVGRAGTGVDNIDLKAATKRGVLVLNTPGGNSTSACELTCSLITCLARHVPQGCAALKDGKWARKQYSGTELEGKTLAILGLGRIGREVAKRMQSFGMKTVGFDPMVSAEDALSFNVQSLSLEEIWPIADYITVHTPLIPQTRNLINNAVLSKCKKGVKIVNVARGGIISEEDLLTALNDGRCGGAALDVFCEEPPKSEASWNLIKHPKAIVTPHLGASTKEAQVRVAVEIAEMFISLNEVGAGAWLNGVVNAPILRATADPRTNSWIELASKLGKVASQILRDSSSNSSPVSVITAGAELAGKNFFSTGVLVGLLDGKVQSEVNLVNAPTLAEENGLKVDHQHDASGHSKSHLVLKANANGQPIEIKGTVDGEKPYLLSINGSVFQPDGIPLTDHSSFVVKAVNPGDVTKTISDYVSKNAHKISIAGGPKTWIAVQLPLK
ncbi:unnamed protein product [Bemisia tabaci]|uniref:D-3-phosphoglycerate dehydrogenase n=1 Tax=Bemisia tabaci TaxID=7038 RepID=A0A9P0AKR4_BEMTA|nr:PREDICTED: D-3-phosphoglycerate dehydrogenase [Bemisia tabaci]CAH0393907.1 unnamed protein product [Bemisia tabaci]